MPKGISHQTENEKGNLYTYRRKQHQQQQQQQQQKSSAERELEHPKTTFFHHFSNYSRSPTYVVVVLFVVNERSKLHTYSAEVPVWPTPVEVAEARSSMTCSVVHGQGKRGNVHIPAIMSVDFPDVVFDGVL